MCQWCHCMTMDGPTALPREPSKDPRRAMPAGAWWPRAISRRCAAGASASMATASISPSSTGCTAGRPRSSPPASPVSICSPRRWWCSSATPSRRFGPRRVMLIGACCFGSAVALLAFINALWQLYLVYLLMAVGAATMHVGAISTVVGLWFDTQAPARHQPGAERRKLRRHLDHAAAGAGDRALWIFQRHPRRDAGDGGGAAAGDRVLDRPPGRRRRDGRRRAARPPPGPGEARCAARSSGAWRRRSRWR